MRHYLHIQTAAIVRAVLVVAASCTIGDQALAFDPDFGAIPAPESGTVQNFKSRTVRIDFDLRSGRSSMTAVELWFTDDLSATWKKAILHDARTTPVVWTAPQDGLFGLYLIVSNAAGASSPPPTAGTAPHQWVRVDSSPTQVRLLAVELDSPFSLSRHVGIRWSAPSDRLMPHPIDIYYRRDGEDLFNLVATALANDGAYRWTVPNDLAGSIAVKVVARDRNGEISEALSPSIEIPIGSAAPDTPAFGTNSAPPAAFPAPARAAPVDDRAVAAAPPPVQASDPRAAQSLMLRGQSHRSRGEWELAEQRFREALQVDPNLRAARLGLASALMKQKNLDAAEQEYVQLLRVSPNDIDAMRGMAMVQISRRRYASAARALDELLRLRADDAEAWLTSGDVAILMGDKVAARRAWRKVESLPNVPGDAVERARKRLVIYPADAQP